MKPEKEMMWLFKLFLSPYARQGLFGTPRAACKKDFERFLGAPRNDGDFTEWLNALIAEGCLIEAGVVENGGRDSLRTVRVYRVDVKKVLERLRENPCYAVACQFYDERSGILGVLT